MIDRTSSWSVRASLIHVVGLCALFLCGGASRAACVEPHADHPPPLSPEESAKRFKMAEGFGDPLGR